MFGSPCVYVCAVCFEVRSCARCVVQNRQDIWLACKCARETEEMKGSSAIRSGTRREGVVGSAVDVAVFRRFLEGEGRRSRSGAGSLNAQPRHHDNATGPNSSEFAVQQ